VKQVTALFLNKYIAGAQQRFNETFGVLTICDIKLRQRVILSIIAMGRIERKIQESKGKTDFKRDLKRFFEINTTLNAVFDGIENHIQERRQHAATTKSAGQADDAKRIHG